MSPNILQTVTVLSPADNHFSNFLRIGDCYGSHMYFVERNNCTSQALHNYCGQGDVLFLWSLVPIATHAIAYKLVFMTALEFISAQSPLKMKGLLVTFWYALSSQRYLLQAVILLYIDKEKVLLIFYGAKADLVSHSGSSPFAP